MRLHDQMTGVSAFQPQSRTTCLHIPLPLPLHYYQVQDEDEVKNKSSVICNTNSLTLKTVCLHYLHWSIVLTFCLCFAVWRYVWKVCEILLQLFECCIIHTYILPTFTLRNDTFNYICNNSGFIYVFD